MRRILGLTILVSFLLPAAAVRAQDRFVTYTGISGQRTMLCELSESGAVRSTVAIMPAGYVVTRLEMGADNRSIRVVASPLSGPRHSVIFEVGPGGGITTVWSGLPLWAVALVLDPMAPSGVAYIAGPQRLEVRG
jgi:hypothetical protein